MVGSHWCARSGQLALKKQRSPYLLLRILSPAAGLPRYLTVKRAQLTGVGRGRRG